jgi:hypothetical protein
LQLSLVELSQPGCLLLLLLLQQLLLLLLLAQQLAYRPAGESSPVLKQGLLLRLPRLLQPHLLLAAPSWSACSGHQQQLVIPLCPHPLLRA